MLGDADEVVAETVGRASEGVELRLVGEELGPVATGDVGWAFVVPAAGASVDPYELKAWCKERLADYKAPDHVRVVDDLPLTSMLKVDKRALADLVGVA